MIHHSPLPDVGIPDLPLTEYILAGGAGQPDKPALIDGASGRVMTYGELEDAIRSPAGGRRAALAPAGAADRVSARRAGDCLVSGPPGMTLAGCRKPGWSSRLSLLKSARLPRSRAGPAIGVDDY